MRQTNFMSHVKLLLKMVSPHHDDLEEWEVDEIKTGTVAHITKLTTDSWIQQHKNQQEAEKQKTIDLWAQTPLVLTGSSPLHNVRFILCF